MSTYDRQKFAVRAATFGDVKPGDYLLDENNNPIKVEDVTETHLPEKMYRVEDDNGHFIDVSGTHLWYIITENDRQTHHERKKLSKKLLTPLLKNKIVTDRLISFANNTYQANGDLEITIVDTLALLFDDENVDLQSPEVIEVFHVVNRIAESVGPVSETNIEYRDMAFENEKEQHKIVFFDARLIAQQILTIVFPRTYKNKYKIRVGKVVTTETMLQTMETGQNVYIPD